MSDGPVILPPGEDPPPPVNAPELGEGYVSRDGLVLLALAPVVLPRPRHITPRAFRARFTQDERAAIELAATDDWEASQQARLLAAGLRADLRETDASNYIDLDLVAQTDRLGPLVALGVLAEGRPAEITGGEIQESERP